jgi:hypothetical protein
MATAKKSKSSKKTASKKTSSKKTEENRRKEEDSCEAGCIGRIQGAGNFSRVSAA